MNLTVFCKDIKGDMKKSTYNN